MSVRQARRSCPDAVVIMAEVTKPVPVTVNVPAPSFPVPSAFRSGLKLPPRLWTFSCRARHC